MDLYILNSIYFNEIVYLDGHTTVRKALENEIFFWPLTRSITTNDRDYIMATGSVNYVFNCIKLNLNYVEQHNLSTGPIR